MFWEGLYQLLVWSKYPCSFQRRMHPSLLRAWQFTKSLMQRSCALVHNTGYHSYRVFSVHGGKGWSSIKLNSSSPTPNPSILAMSLVFNLGFGVLYCFSQEYTIKTFLMANNSNASGLNTMPNFMLICQIIKYLNGERFLESLQKKLQKFYAVWLIQLAYPYVTVFGCTTYHNICKYFGKKDCWFHGGTIYMVVKHVEARVWSRFFVAYQYWYC